VKNSLTPQIISLDNKTGFGYSDEYGFADGASNGWAEADTQFPIFDLSALQKQRLHCMRRHQYC